MTIEERLVHDLSTTEHPGLAVWLLADGRFVNGSHEGHQRDVDHHEIGSYFKKSKKEKGNDPRLYMEKFMRRGNMRWGFSDCGLVLEFMKTPTANQLDTIFTWCLHVQVAVMYGGEWHDLAWFLDYVKRYCRDKGEVYYDL